MSSKSIIKFTKCKWYIIGSLKADGGKVGAAKAQNKTTTTITMSAVMEKLNHWSLKNKLKWPVTKNYINTEQK